MDIILHRCACFSSAFLCYSQKEVQVGIFHGGEEVCESQTTSRQRGIHPVWNEYLQFQLPVSEIPRMARICLCIVGYKNKESKKKKVGRPLPVVPTKQGCCGVAPDVLC